MTIIQHILVLGRVQGVGFRHFTLRRAQELGLLGWVRNLTDGRVEVLASGTAEQLALFCRDLRQGPRMAKVSSIQVCDVTLKVGLNTFTVKEDGENEWQKDF